MDTQKTDLKSTTMTIHWRGGDVCMLVLWLCTFCMLKKKVSGPSLLRKDPKINE